MLSKTINIDSASYIAIVSNTLAIVEKSHISIFA